MASIPHSPYGKIAICMGSQSDWHTMQNAASMLDDLGAAIQFLESVEVAAHEGEFSLACVAAHFIEFAVVAMVAKRRKLLDYLKRNDEERYQKLIKSLGIRR